MRYVITIADGWLSLYGPYKDEEEILNSRPWGTVDAGERNKDWFIVEATPPDQID